MSSTQKVTVAQRLRALGRDRGRTSPTAGLELGRLAEDVAALEELKDVVERLAADLEDAGPSHVAQRIRVVLEELEAREARR